jgi:SAM-dependent methyltransferase
MTSVPVDPPPTDLAPALEDLGVATGEVVPLGTGPASWLLMAADPGGAVNGEALGGALEQLAPGGTLLLFVPGVPDNAHLARWRNALWPELHTGRWYGFTVGRVRRHTLAGQDEVGASPLTGALIVARRRSEVMSPEATVEKFDLNAAGWDGQPGTPGYPHHRWMRKFVGLFAKPQPGARILDFGCGAGWCGIEAAKRAPGSHLCSFDPSPQMVRITGENAAGAGLDDFTGRTGFGEDPPFPAEGEEPFDLVISSGVISFSPDSERWLDGLARAVKPGGILVVGDIHRESRGFRKRRGAKPLLPVRELNAKTRDEVRAGLEQRGFKFECWAGYQLSWPIPQLMHLNETKLKGVLTYPLLWANQLAASLDRGLGSPLQAGFDSWVMRLRRER